MDIHRCILNIVTTFFRIRHGMWTVTQDIDLREINNYF